MALGRRGGRTDASPPPSAQPGRGTCVAPKDLGVPASCPSWSSGLRSLGEGHLSLPEAGTGCTGSDAYLHSAYTPLIWQPARPGGKVGRLGTAWGHLSHHRVLSRPGAASTHASPLQPKVEERTRATQLGRLRGAIWGPRQLKEGETAGVIEAGGEDPLASHAAPPPWRPCPSRGHRAGPPCCPHQVLRGGKTGRAGSSCRVKPGNPLGYQSLQVVQ